MSKSLRRNIEALAERRKYEAANASAQERLADAITSFVGSMTFVYIHAGLYSAWLLANSGLIAALPKFDPSLIILAMEASVEAIFLSTFVLISQNRMNAASDKRADLDLHISLLTEHELTKLTEVVTEIAARLKVEIANDPELAEVKQDVAPEAVLDEIDARRQDRE